MLKTCKGLPVFAGSPNSLSNGLDNMALLCLFLSVTDLWPKPNLPLDRLSSFLTVPWPQVCSRWLPLAAPPQAILPFSELSDSSPCTCYLVACPSPHLIEVSWGDRSLAISFVLPSVPLWCGVLSVGKALRWLWNMSIQFPQSETLTLSPIMVPLRQLNRIRKAQDCWCLKDRMSGSLEF